MKIFFGKISDKYDLKQIEDGYYQAPKNSTWFNGINVDDYSFVIGGNRIQLWRARNGIKWLIAKMLDSILKLLVVIQA